MQVDCSFEQACAYMHEMQASVWIHAYTIMDPSIDISGEIYIYICKFAMFLCVCVRACVCAYLQAMM